MCKYALTWFLVVCFACSNGEDCRKENDSNCFWIRSPINTTIENSTRLIITKGNCTENPANNATINKNKENYRELIKLSNYYYLDSNGFVRNFIGIADNFPQNLKSLLIALTISDGTENYEMCLEVNANESFQLGHKISTIIVGDIETMIVDVKGFHENEIYRQRLFVCDQKPSTLSYRTHRRFVYADASTEKDTDIVHISEIDGNDDGPNIYQVLRKNKDNQTEIIYYTYSTEYVTHALRSTDSHWYFVENIPRTYRAETVLSAMAATLVILCAMTAALWYASNPKLKQIVVIYCQCDRHSIQNNVVQKLLSFFEQNCLMKFETQADALPDSPGLENDAGNLIGQPQSVDCVIFIPFPNVADHDRSCERQVHQLCDRYQHKRKKIELNLPFDNNGSNLGVIRSEWMEGSFESFQLFEEHSKFIEYVHPFYLPAFSERFIRPQLWGPHLANVRTRNTFTNDHFREITDPKLYAKTVRNPFQVDTNLAVNAFI